MEFQSGKAQIALIWALIMVFAISACNKTNHTTFKTFDPAYSSYVSAYSSGVISRTSEVIINFAEDVAEPDQVGEAIEQGVLSFTPALKGKAVWENQRSIRFTPSDKMPSNTTFDAKVNLKKLFTDVPAELRDFKFDFATKEQFFQVKLNGVRAESSTDFKKVKLNGEIVTADYEDKEAVKKLINFDQKGNKNLAVTWEHSADHLTHQFTVNNLSRSNKASKVDIEWSGSQLNLDIKGSQVVEIPALGDFKVTEVHVVQQGEQRIRVLFSDPIQASQDLNGLISLANYSSALRFTVDGNEVNVYPSSRVIGNRRIKINRGVKNAMKQTMKENSEWELIFEQMKPEIKLVGNGVIMPNSDGLMFPFEAVSLNAVDVEVMKIYESNVLQFMQVNNLAGSYELERVGKLILQKKIELSKLNRTADTGKWMRYALDLSQLINQDPGAIYQVRIGFRKEYSTYSCEEGLNADVEDDEGDYYHEYSDNQTEDDIQSFWRSRYYWNYPGYRYSHRKNPCYPPYYNYDRFIRRNIISSNIGLIAKKGNDNSMLVAVSDLLTTKPISGAKVNVYDYQQQVLKEITTDGDGIATFTVEGKPYMITAGKGRQRGYLRVRDGESLSLSRFDVSGESSYKGIKGMLYGERGVWRPGDTLFLTFILEDKLKNLPPEHPVTLELYDPRGQLQQKVVRNQHLNEMYHFRLTTEPSAPTGNWQARVKVGGAVFTKTLKIETVKPNRLKINIDFGKEELVAGDDLLRGGVQVNWLHGAPARNLKTVIKANLRQVNTTFPKYSDFEFDDPARKFSSEPFTVFEGEVNNDGFAPLETRLAVGENAPGKLRANFSSRAFEKGGDFSSDNFSMPYSPYKSYVGLHIPKNKYGSKRLDKGEKNNLEIAVVNTEGQPISGRNVKVGLYRVDWRWWWERSEDNVTNFSSSSHYGSIETVDLTTNKKGEVVYSVTPNDWGRYLVRVCDTESGHCTGDFYYAGYPWDDGSQDNSGASILAFSSTKEKYNVGDAVELNIPTGEAGRALITIESGTNVVEHYWMDAVKGNNTFRFYANEKMSPTVYAHVTLVQPHGQVQNDLPIRMYGVVPIQVEDPKTRITPVLDMAEVLEPESEVSIRIAEDNGKPMTYTIAMVDDGLLDLTRFKTPDPWSNFYRREAIGVKTWDMYNDVLGAYGGQLERILSIGGDEAVGPKGGKKANRFKPVVQYLGPFYLKAGEKRNHTVKMPNYVGSVRTMVVASSNGAYGNAQKTTPVRKPLMVLGTLPRVLGPGEIVVLPVNVFAMEKNIKNVSVNIKTNNKLEMVGPAKKTVQFNAVGDQVVNFEFKVKENIGLAEVEILVSGNGSKASQKIELDIRNPNPYITNVVEKILEEGESWETAYEPAGMMGTNKGVLELSNIPPINLGERLSYLLRYPHGCIEQTTSSGFPQLYAGRLLELTPDQVKQTKLNIEATIKRLKLFQVSAGGFSYWPGDSEPSHWGSNYAGHFILEAKAIGYSIPPNMLTNWKKYQKRLARSWTPATGRRSYYRNDDLMQAYRLYTLALANAPEMGAMNSLRERKTLTNSAKWRLAAAYALAGKPEAAKKLISGLETNVEPYQELGYTYGSDLRDMAMIMESLLLMEDRKGAARLVQNVSKQLSSSRWYSTQTTAYSLLAVGKFVGEGGTSNDFKFSYALNGGATTNGGSAKPVVQHDLNVDGTGNHRVTVKNTGKGILYARIILDGQPVVGDESEAENSLIMAVNYKTLKGELLDPRAIEQGQDFIAEVTVKNPGARGNYEEMTLNQVFPSGWEIHNTRMNNVDGFSNTHVPEYQDIRDDRVYTYFDISAGQQHVYRVQLNAAYQGRFYMPNLLCEAMYDNTINARKPGSWVNVIPAGEPQ